MTPEQREDLLLLSQASLPRPLRDTIGAGSLPTPASSLPPTPAPTPPPTPLEAAVVFIPTRVKDPMPLHRRTSTFPVWSVEPDFLNQEKCARCTARVVHVYEPESDAEGEYTQRRAAVEWGFMPYLTTTDQVGQFTYYTMETAASLRPELMEAWDNRPVAEEGESAETVRRRRLWVADRLRDSWVIEQLVYWVEYLYEWRYYREYYVFREEFFEDSMPEVLSPPCAHCGQEEKGGEEQQAGEAEPGESAPACEGTGAGGETWRIHGAHMASSSGLVGERRDGASE